MPADTEKLVPIEDAAKAIGIGRDRARRDAIRAGIAIRWGGSEAHPWLRVRISELRRVVESNRYIPAAAQNKSRRRHQAGPTRVHPLVKC